VSSEFPGRAGENGRFADEGKVAIAGDGFRAGLTVSADKFWFFVEQIELRGCTDHVQADQVSGFGSEVWWWLLGWGCRRQWIGKAAIVAAEGCCGDCG
jgi:hypothetical protein